MCLFFLHHVFRFFKFPLLQNGMISYLNSGFLLLPTLKKADWHTGSTFPLRAEWRPPPTQLSWGTGPLGPVPPVQPPLSICIIWLQPWKALSTMSGDNCCCGCGHAYAVSWMCYWFGPVFQLACEFLRTGIVWEEIIKHCFYRGNWDILELVRAFITGK